MSTVKANAFLDASGGNTATINSMTPTGDSLQGFRNRIINGDMRIDQRNAGASATLSNGGYSLDRWKTNLSVSSKYTVQQNAGSVTPPAGFTNYLGVTSSSAYTSQAADNLFIGQQIEGYNIADLGWGTANAKTITISFWVRSSLTGTFGGSVNNSLSRSYPFTYTISSANTWEYKTITIPGDTTGTWVTTNGAALWLTFNLGTGSNGSGTAGAWSSTVYYNATGSVSVTATNAATWYITGVQLEAGSVATPFERRPYGTELALCQRYYYQYNAGSFTSDMTFAFAGSSTLGRFFVQFPVTMRATPTVNATTGSNYYSFYLNGVDRFASSVDFPSTPTTTIGIMGGTISGATAYQIGTFYVANASGKIGFQAEL